MATKNDTPEQKAKHAAYMRAYYAKNREKWKAVVKKSAAKQKAANPEKWKARINAQSKKDYHAKMARMTPEEKEVFKAANRARDAKYREKHRNDPKYKARVAANTRRQYAKNPEKFKAVVYKRRMTVECGEVTTQQWNEILALYRHRCAYCRRDDVKLTQDHVQALTKGGKHEPENVVPCCASCNTRKGNRPWPKPLPPTD